MAQTGSDENDHYAGETRRRRRQKNLAERERREELAKDVAAARERARGELMAKLTIHHSYANHEMFQPHPEQDESAQSTLVNSGGNDTGSDDEH